MNTRYFLSGCVAALTAGTLLAATRVTTPVRITQTVDGQFPASLAFSPITSGEVRLIANIDADGRLADVMITGYTHEAFEQEALHLLREWRYAPARVNGEAVGVRTELKMQFVSTGRVVSLNAFDSTAVLTGRNLSTPFVNRLCAPGDLDRPLEAIRVASPLHPAPGTSPDTGATLVDFYVDEAGRIRMPVIVETTNQAYAEAAVSALDQWRFSPPTRRGEPVAVRVRQQFIFSKPS